MNLTFPLTAAMLPLFARLPATPRSSRFLLPPRLTFMMKILSASKAKMTLLQMTTLLNLHPILMIGNCLNYHYWSISMALNSLISYKTHKQNGMAVPRGSFLISMYHLTICLPSIASNGQIRSNSTTLCSMSCPSMWCIPLWPENSYTMVHTRCQIRLDHQVFYARRTCFC